LRRAARAERCRAAALRPARSHTRAAHSPLADGCRPPSAGCHWSRPLSLLRRLSSAGWLLPHWLLAGGARRRCSTQRGRPAAKAARTSGAAGAALARPHQIARRQAQAAGSTRPPNQNSSQPASQQSRRHTSNTSASAATSAICHPSLSVSRVLPKHSASPNRRHANASSFD